MFNGWICNRWSIYADLSPFFEEKSHQPVERKRYAIGDVIVCTRKNRDAQGPNIHIIRLETYRGRRIHNLARRMRLRTS